MQLPVNGPTDVDVSCGAVDREVVVVLTAGSNGILDLVERRVVSVSSPNRENWLLGEIGVLHDLDGVRRMLEDGRVVVAVQDQHGDGGSVVATGISAIFNL